MKELPNKYAESYFRYYFFLEERILKMNKKTKKQVLNLLPFFGFLIFTQKKLDLKLWENVSSIENGTYVFYIK